MKNEQLNTLLEKVHAELQNVETVNEDSLKLLQELEQDVQSLLKMSDVETPSILERINKGIERFQMEHPTLAALLSEASAILNNAGI